MRASRVLRARDDENNAYFTRQTSCHVVDKAESRVDHFSEISLPLMIIISYNMIALPSSFCLVVYLTINHGQRQRCREIERFKPFDNDANDHSGQEYVYVTNLIMVSQKSFIQNIAARLFLNEGSTG